MIRLQRKSGLEGRNYTSRGDVLLLASPANAFHSPPALFNGECTALAIPHFSVSIIKRGSGRSAVLSAAYRHCTRMTFEQEARVIDYSRKGGLMHEEFSIPKIAPSWVTALVSERTVAGASEAFWNRVEAFEKRSDAQLAKDVTIALPRELSPDQCIALVREFVETHITSKGMVADWVFHESGIESSPLEHEKPDFALEDDGRNPHIHLMMTLRPLSENGFGPKKTPVLSTDGKPLRNEAGKIVYVTWSGGPDEFEAFRDGWFSCQNRHLALAGLDLRIDGRSFEKQGIDLVPTIHLGAETKAIERKALAEKRMPSLDLVDLQQARRAENARRILANPRIVIDTVAREKSVFDERDLAKVLSRSIDDIGQFQSLLARLFQHPDLLRLDRERFDFVTGRKQPAKYTTRDLLRLEAQMVSRAQWLSRQRSHRVRRVVLERTFVAHPHLSAEQQTAVERVTGKERIAAVIGRAGAGKTTMMKAAREVWERAGYRVVGGALAGKAAEGLEKEAGIRSLTLSSWQLRWQSGHDDLDGKSVFVLDEAGMVSSRQMADLVKAVADSGAKLVLVGDPEQLQPIEAGAAFRAIAERTGYAELDTIYRQRQPWMRDASLDLARGATHKALDVYGANGRLVSADLKTEAIEQLIDDWTRDYDPSRTSLILAHLRRDVRHLNELARERLVTKGLLEEGSAFQAHEGRRMFAAGDQVVFLRNENQLGVKNGMLGKILRATPGRILVQIGEGTGCCQVAVDQTVYNDLDHGYATTIHKAQGATVDRVKVLASLSLDRHLTYVAMTRHREDLRVYFGQKSFDRNGGLAQMLSRRNAKETTLDYADLGLYSQALHFAEARGLHILHVARTIARDRFEWIVRQKELLHDLAHRLAGLKARLWRSDDIEAARVRNAVKEKPMVEGMKHFAQSLDQAVEERLAADPALKSLWEEVSARFRYVYEKPEAAFAAMEMEKALKENAWAAGLVAKLKSAPETFGPLRGRVGILASGAEKSDRDRALKQVPLLAEGLADFIRQRAVAQQRYGSEEDALRKQLALDIPALSGDARRVLEKVRDAIDRNDLKSGLEFALADKMVKAELEVLAKAIDQRFGERRFLNAAAADAEGEKFRTLSAHMNAEQREAFRQALPMLQAVQQLAAGQRMGRNTKRETTSEHERLLARQGLSL